VLNVNRARQVLLALKPAKHVKIAALVNTVKVKKKTVSALLIRLYVFGAPLGFFLVIAAAVAKSVNLESLATPLVAVHVKIAHLVQKEATKIPIRPLVSIAQEVFTQILIGHNSAKLVTQVNFQTKQKQQHVKHVQQIRFKMKKDKIHASDALPIY
jgi:hypothetical protein